MAVFKCKMCGGALEVTEGMTVCECEYCGTQQTLPKTDNEQKLNMFNRANHFRQQCEFDKAAEIYEKMAAQSGTDAELYWSIVLCRYGIEYVDDPLTKKKIATCHRTQFKSILDDPDYQTALQYADMAQRSVYEREAAYIDKVQKGILEISNKEQPFDVFICYKETDENGRRTQDSVLAQELYYGLTQEGFKVFFSRITLESKLGTEYEPYIFAALNSAKVMVVVGTKPEFFNAVWVRNEWSRYLMLMQEDRSRTLIPAYKDMDPYELPDALSMFQAQDMSKLGFMQDLIRGIKKIAKTEPEQTVVRETVVQAVSSNAENLLKRGNFALEDGKWQEAAEFFEQVLNENAEEPRAYLGKLMAELQIRKQDDLPHCAEPFDSRDNYKKAVRFGDEKLKEYLGSCITYINQRNEQTRLNGLYQAAKQKMASARSHADFVSAEQAFRGISGYQDADALAAECAEKGEAARIDAIYQDANAKLREDTIDSVAAAAELYRKIPAYQDAQAKISQAETRLAELKAEKAAREQEAERQRINEENARRAKAAKAKRLALIGGIAAVLAVAVIITVPMTVKASKYKQAVTMMESGQYEDAKAAFADLGDYKDTSAKLSEIDKKIQEINDLNFETEFQNEFQNAEIYDVVHFGNYEWYILSISDDNKMELLCKDTVGHRQFDSSQTDDTKWEECELREWLNSSFYNEFSDLEKEKIVKTTHSDKLEEPEKYQDYVYLMSSVTAQCIKEELPQVLQCDSEWWIVYYWFQHTHKDREYIPISKARQVKASGEIEGTPKATLELGVRPVITIQVS